ncbi:MAG: hypothetical protein HRT45_15650 [Bdellovibrionales bacterium]|nr:hypothetical protein [Bdellovibrionales bacterium]
MKSTAIKYGVSLVSCLILVACGANEDLEVTESVDEVALSVESGLLVIGNTADDTSGEVATSQALSASDELAISGKTTCSQVAALNSCQVGVKTAEYNDCQPLYTLGSLAGSVQLDFSQDDCDNSLSGDTVTRTYDLTYTSVRGRTFSVSSAIHNDYNGNSLGGGSTLTRTSTGFELVTDGQRRTYRGRAGQPLIDMTISTASPVVIEGTLTRSNRTVTSGEILIAHNRAKFTTSLKPSNLKWTGVCCHPISGRLDITMSGSRNNSGTVTFEQCGQARFDSAEGSRTLTIENCH